MGSGSAGSRVKGRGRIRKLVSFLDLSGPIWRNLLYILQSRLYRRAHSTQSPLRGRAHGSAAADGDAGETSQRGAARQGRASVGRGARRQRRGSGRDKATTRGRPGAREFTLGVRRAPRVVAAKVRAPTGAGPSGTGRAVAGGGAVPGEGRWLVTVGAAVMRGRSRESLVEESEPEAAF